MKVYRDFDGRPVLVGECAVRLPDGGRMPELVQTYRRLRWGEDDPTLSGIVAGDIWVVGLVGIPVGTRFEYIDVIKLRDGDDPQHLPGWMTAVTASSRDPDGDLVPLPEREFPQAPPFVPNKFGEHG